MWNHNYKIALCKFLVIIVTEFKSHRFLLVYEEPSNPKQPKKSIKRFDSGSFHVDVEVTTARVCVFESVVSLDIVDTGFACQKVTLQSSDLAPKADFGVERQMADEQPEQHHEEEVCPVPRQGRHNIKTASINWTVIGIGTLCNWQVEENQKLTVSPGSQDTGRTS